MMESPVSTRKRPPTRSPIEMQQDILMAANKNETLKKQRVVQQDIKSMLTKTSYPTEPSPPTVRELFYSEGITEQDDNFEDLLHFPEAIKDIDKSLLADTVSTIASKVADSFRQAPVQNLLRNMISEIVNDSLEKFVSPLKEEVNCLKIELARVTNCLNNKIQMRTDELEQYSRKNCIRINGIEEQNKEDVEKKSLDVLQIVCPNVVSSDIENCHRVGKPERGPRQIILRFNSYKSKRKIFSDMKQHKNLPENVYINEDLTKYRSYIYSLTRKAYKSKSISQCWTRDGKVFVRLNPVSEDELGKVKRILTPLDIPGYAPSEEEIIKYCGESMTPAPE
ncbi:hypothetical protein SNE40_011190 [Patella caerulea]|uniref:Uncharacterized protein n=2 Tax=Patella caerulea TaxID=87958 RepID=A0AAN8PHK2_PATCE